MDDRSPEQRSKTMAAVKSIGTQLERSFFIDLDTRGVTGTEQHPEDIYGKPDLVHRTAKIAVFIDSCFWHGCPQHLRMPSSNRGYWERKIARNRERDVKVTRQLQEGGWLVLRVWEHSLKQQRSKKWWLTRIVNLVDARTN